MGWRCIRALKKVSAIAIPALQSAQDDPIPANVEEMATRPTFSLGDTMALGLMYREIFGNAKALQDDSECGERLRNIADAWRCGKARATSSRRSTRATLRCRPS
jgi:hypothetical protein